MDKWILYICIEKRHTETKGPIQTPKELQPISSSISCHLGETKEATVTAAYNVDALSGNLMSIFFVMSNEIP